MSGIGETIQRMVDGLGLPSDIGNRGTSVNKRLDPVSLQWYHHREAYYVIGSCSFPSQNV